jgi:acetylglutamate kinase
MKKACVIKVGGAIFDNAKRLESFLTAVARIPVPCVLVHGGGNLVSNEVEKMGIKPVFVNGRRKTDQATLDALVMILAGRVNKEIVAKLNQAGRPAIGLSGVDGAFLTAKRRKPGTFDFGLVGDIEKVDTRLVMAVLDMGYTVVVPPLSYSPAEGLLNTNADTVAGEIAAALAETYDTALIYCFDQSGVLRDPKDPQSVIEEIALSELSDYIEKGIITGGMIAKLENAILAAKKGVSEVNICSDQNLAAFFNGEKVGTRIAEH